MDTYLTTDKIIIMTDGKPVGAIDSIHFDKDISDDTLYPYRMIFADKIYENFDIEITYKSGDVVFLKDFCFTLKPPAFCAQDIYILVDAVITKYTVKKEEEDHSGQIYNAYTDTWSWL